MAELADLIREILDNPFVGRGLTPRQELIAGMRARGLLNSEIADELDLSRNTVKTHIRNAREQLGLEDPTQSLSTLMIRQIEAVLDTKGA